MNVWNAATAEWYARRHGESAASRLAVDALELAPGSVIVDVGCGTGAALRHAAARAALGVLIGIDPVPRMLEIAQERAAPHPHAGLIEFGIGAAEALPVEDAAADVVFAFDSFDHWSNQAHGLAEIRRVLRPEGRLVVTKDAGVPDARQGRQTLARALARAGFSVSRQDDIHARGVSFTLFECAAADQLETRPLR